MERDLERGEMREGSCGGEDDDRKRLSVLNLKIGRDLRWLFLFDLIWHLDCVSTEDKKDGVLEQFNHTNSVRDRMRKFTEPTPSPNAPALKKAPLRNGTTNGGQANLSATTASHSTSGDRPVKPHKDSAFHTSTTSQNPTTPQPRGVASKPLSPAGQWQHYVGGTRHPDEKDVHASSKSKEDEAPGRAAGQQFTQGEAADPDMKTFLTVEIKDGRAGSSSASAARGNIVPITNLTPRIATNALGQRAGTITWHSVSAWNQLLVLCSCAPDLEEMLDILRRALLRSLCLTVECQIV